MPRIAYPMQCQRLPATLDACRPGPPSPWSDNIVRLLERRGMSLGCSVLIKFTYFTSLRKTQFTLRT